jgi:hypothetical protein
MKSGQIWFKFKRENVFDVVKFDGESITLKQLKTKIKEKKQDKISTGSAKEKEKYDLRIYDEQTSKEYKEENSKIPADTKVTIERIPFNPSMQQQQNNHMHRQRQDYKKTPTLPNMGQSNAHHIYPPQEPPQTQMGIPQQKPENDEFTCKICRNILANPVLTHCGETCCKTCAEKHVAETKKCPFCHKEDEEIISGPNMKMQQLIEKSQAKAQEREMFNYPVQTAYQQYPSGYGSPSYDDLPVITYADFRTPSYNEVQKYLQDAKFFIIKSSNSKNIELSVKHKEWATTKNNEGKLNQIFASTRNVILIFSVNKKSQFTGFARMESPISKKIGSYWQDQDTIRLGGCFAVRWLRVCSVQFNRISHLRNNLNNNEPIKKSRDCQEIPEDIGKEICAMFERPDMQIVQPPPQAAQMWMPPPQMSENIHTFQEMSMPNSKPLDMKADTTSSSVKTESESDFNVAQSKEEKPHKEKAQFEIAYNDIEIDWDDEEAQPNVDQDTNETSKPEEMKTESETEIEIEIEPEIKVRPPPPILPPNPTPPMPFITQPPPPAKPEEHMMIPKMEPHRMQPYAMVRPPNPFAPPSAYPPVFRPPPSFPAPNQWNMPFANANSFNNPYAAPVTPWGMPSYPPMQYMPHHLYPNMNMNMGYPQEKFTKSSHGGETDGKKKEKKSKTEKRVKAVSRSRSRSKSKSKHKEAAKKK